MNRYLQSALVAALGVASITYAFAQENPAPPATQQDPTATQTPPPATESSTPSRQRQAAAGTSKDTHKQMLNDCIAKEQANGSGVSKSQAKKDCKAQMKSNTSQPKSY